MTFIERIQPHLDTQDYLIQQQVLHAIEEYPHVPEEWITILIKKAFTHKELQTELLMYTPKHSVNEEALKVLLQHVRELDPSSIHLVVPFFENLAASLALTYQEQLEPYLDSRYWRIFELVQKGVREDVIGAYEELLALLETAESFDHIVYFQAKYVAKAIVENGWFSNEEIGDMLKKDKRKKWYSFSATLAVYIVGLLRLEEHIPQLAGILAKPDDTLAGEASAALIAFQSDEVVKAVAPYLANDDSFVYALSVLEYIKTEASAQALMDAYNQTDELANQDMIFEALAHHYSTETVSFIQKHLENEYQSSMIELEPVAYGYFKILGIHHPHLSFWRQVALETEMEFQEANQTPIVAQNKVGRNDPCTCGSGKKYKKCCG